MRQLGRYSAGGGNGDFAMARVKTRLGRKADFPAYWRGLKDRLETDLVR